MAAAIEDARPPAYERIANANDPDVGQPRYLGDLEAMPGNWEPGPEGLPPDCPVWPLGVDGDYYWLIDTIGQLRCVKDTQFNRAKIQSLFAGRINYLFWAYPRKDKDGHVTSWRPERVGEDLVSAAALQGPWDSVEKVRGRGAWLARDGSLVYHCGEHLYINGKRDDIGELGGHVYPTRPAIPAPWPKKVSNKDNPARPIMKLFRRFEWVRAEVDPVLLLGQVCTAFVGGALPWRPPAFITGDKATGKSTLQAIYKALLGAALIQSADTTPAGIYQHVGQDSLAVAIDELEAETESGKAAQIIKLARLSASGALMLRGGAEHKGVEFQARSTFLFSSINAPPLQPQDLSRMALLRLQKLPDDAEALHFDPAELAMMGRKILRILCDNWHRFPATFAAYKETLAGAGHDGRGQDTFGTLLACVDLLAEPIADKICVPLGPEIDEWKTLLQARGMAEYADALPNWWNCLSHLLSVPVDAWRNGTKQVVGQIVDDLVNGRGGDYQDNKKLLAQAGLGIPRPKASDDLWLAIPNQNTLTRKLFVGSKWCGDEGAGVWGPALQQAPKDLWRSATCRVNGVSQRCTMIKLIQLKPMSDQVLDIEGGSDDED